MRHRQRRVAMATTAVGLVLLVVVAVWRVPWDPAGGRLVAAPVGDWFTAGEIRRGNDFASWARVWSLASLLVSLVVAGALGLTRVGARLVARLWGPWWIKAVLGVAVLELTGRLVTLPFAVLLRRRVRAYDLSRQDWWGFAADLLRTQAVTIVATSIGVLVFLLIARRWPRAWPAVAGTALAALVMLGSFVYPLLVEPVFSRFTPLPDGPLRTGVLTLAAREQVRVDDVLVADASRRTTTINAYVSGFGSSRRVVLYDTLVDDLPRDEALSVVAHELTHAREDDVLTGSLLGALGALTGTGLLGLLLVVRPEGDRGSGTRLGPADVPRLLALVAIASVLVLPAQNAVSRRIETRADVGALGATEDPGAFIGLQQELARRSAADLTPPAGWQWWFGSHPTALTRIALALRAQDEGNVDDSAGPRH